MSADLTVTALRNAVALRGPTAAVDIPIGQSVPLPQLPASTPLHWAARVDGASRTCANNAAMESFFSLLQKNVLDRRRCPTRTELRLAMVTSIETTYHRRRRQDALGRLTPVEFETLIHAAHAAWPRLPDRVNRSLGSPIGVGVL